MRAGSTPDKCRTSIDIQRACGSGDSSLLIMRSAAAATRALRRGGMYAHRVGSSWRGRC
jgi:hypothetical protein